ncbi:hypothetical protein GQR58_030153 [Nymphon striatum]|nr:hypothetical protein GQR58_030153 [Nymphon striatum]
MARLDDAILAGTVPGLSRINDVFADDIHPNDLGFYYLSLFQYAVLTGQSPIGLPHALTNPWGETYTAPSPAMALRLQQIAARAARKDTQRTVLPPDPPPLPRDPPPVRLNQPEAPPAASRSQARRQPMAMNLAPVVDWSPQVSEPFQNRQVLDWPSPRTVGRRNRSRSAGSWFSGSGRLAHRDPVWFDFTPGPGLVDIRIQRTDRQGTGDYIRDISIVKQEHIAAYSAGELFNPRWLDLLDGFKVLRFMDWMETNNSKIGWEDRPLVLDYTWARQGVPAEIMLRLANELGAAPWVSMPHQSDDSYMRNFARLAHQLLDQDLRIYVEYSNEVWNWQFDQAHWAEAQGKARWGGDHLWMQFYAGRAAEMRPCGPPSAAMANRPRDISTLTTGYFGGVLGRDDYVDVVRAWIADSRAHADTAAIERGLTGAARREFMERHQFDIAIAQATAELRDGLISGTEADTLADVLNRILPYQADIARAHGLDLIMYEGGSHVVGVGANVEDPVLTAFFTHFNYTPEMGALYTELLAGWQDLGGQLFAAYADVYAPGKWGSWGGTLSDNNPRWTALEAAK